jgi:hypothetical protein
MGKLPEQHYDITGHVKAKPSARHIHPHDLVPIRVARESGFAGAGLDVPAKQSRPSRSADMPKSHPVNRPIGTENKSNLGRLGEHQKDMAVTPIHGQSGNSHIAEPPPRKL